MCGARQAACGFEGAQGVAEGLVADAQGGAEGAMRRGAIVVPSASLARNGGTARRATPGTGVRAVSVRQAPAVAVAHGEAPSDSAGASRRCQGCFRLPRCPPAQAALSFSRLAATSRWRWPPTTAWFKNASWRSMSATHSRSAQAALKSRSTRSGATRAARWSRVVVFVERRRLTPAIPASRISRPIRFAPICLPCLLAQLGVDPFT